MTWKETLLSKCYTIMNTGGEVVIQFSIRRRGSQLFVVPIVKSYPSNQVICKEEEIELDD